MRRTLLALLACVLASVAAGLTPPPAQAGSAHVTGRLYEINAGVPAPGVTVNLREVTEGGPDDILGTGVTDSTGFFDIEPLVPLQDEYYVEVVGNDQVQFGWVDGGDPNYVQQYDEYAATFSATEAIGRIWVNPSYVRGRVVNPRNGNPVAGVTVSLRLADDPSTSVGVTTTNAQGRFRIGGILGEDFNLRLIGEAVGFENGWRACNGTVVRTLGAACASPIGQIGRVRLDRL